MKNLIYVVLVSGLVISMVHGMEEVPSRGKSPARWSQNSNARNYEKVGCFSWLRTKKHSFAHEDRSAKMSAELLEAVINNGQKSIIIYVNHGNIVNKKDDCGLAPLHYVARNVNVAFARDLLAAPHIDLTSTTPQGLTAVQIVELRKDHATTDQERQKCDALIALITACQQRKEAQRSWIITQDIGALHPVPDAQGNLWVFKDGEFLMCGTVGTGVMVEEDMV